MNTCGIVFAFMMLLMPGLVAAQAGGPPPGPPAGVGADTPPWLTAQAGPPSLTPGPGPQPPRPHRSMGPGMGAWWKNSEIARKIELSEAQVSQIEQTFVEHRLRLVDLRAELEKQELRLPPLLDVDRPDETKVSAQIDLVTAARARLDKESAMMMLAIRRVLSVEQWKMLQTLSQEREGEWGRRGDPPPSARGPQPSRRPPTDAPR
jgi:periplasmic protein CpxP/Spy